MLQYLRLLKPSPAELERFAHRETDPENHADFQPITAGPAAAFAALCIAGVAAICISPFRLTMRLIEKAAKR